VKTLLLIQAAVLFLYSSVTSASFAPHSPHLLESYESDEKIPEGFTRLRINIAVSDNTVSGDIKSTSMVVCSDDACWKPATPSTFPVKRTSDGQSYLVADALVPEIEIKHIYFEDNSANNSVEGDIALDQPLKTSSEYQGHQIYVILEQLQVDNRTVYKPHWMSAMPWSAYAPFTLIDPKFTTKVRLASGTEITFPKGALNKPQLFVIVEHDVGDKFPMIDIGPYIHLNKKALITLKPIRLSTKSIGADTDSFSIEIQETKVIPGSNKKSDIKSDAGTGTKTLAAALTCAQTITGNLAAYKTLLPTSGVVRISACEQIAPNIHIALINTKDTRIKYSIPTSVASSTSLPHVLNLRHVTDYNAIVAVNGFTWTGDKGTLLPVTQKGTANGFLTTGGIVRAKNTNQGNKLIMGLSNTKAIRFFETSISTANFGLSNFNLVSSSTSIVKNGVCQTLAINSRWSGIGANPTTGEMVIVSSTSASTTNAPTLCPVFKAFGIQNALLLDGSTAAGMTVSNVLLNPIGFPDNILYGSVRRIAYPIAISH